MKPWVIFKSGALNFWWPVTETGITTIQKSHPLTDRDRHLRMISSNPLPSNFFPAPLIQTYPFVSCFQFSAIMPLAGHCLAGHWQSDISMQATRVWSIKTYISHAHHILCPMLDATETDWNEQNTLPLQKHWILKQNLKWHCDFPDPLETMSIRETSLSLPHHRGVR